MYYNTVNANAGVHFICDIHSQKLRHILTTDYCVTGHNSQNVVIFHSYLIGSYTAFWLDVCH